MQIPDMACESEESHLGFLHAETLMALLSFFPSANDGDYAQERFLFDVESRLRLLRRMHFKFGAPCEC